MKLNAFTRAAMTIRLRVRSWKTPGRRSGERPMRRLRPPPDAHGMRLHPSGALRSLRAARGGGRARHIETFVMAGIGTVLATRAYLAATGYPRIGAGGLHVAHVLWGGLLLTAALAMSLLLHGYRAHGYAAAVGGAGFGLFVDEVGKFVTADNDYFYRPAAGIIYLVFALLVVFVWWLRARPEPRPPQPTMDGIDEALGSAAHGLTDRQRTAAADLIGHPDGDVRQATLRLLGAVPYEAEPAPRAWRAVADRTRVPRARLARHRWLGTVAALWLVAQPPLSLIGTLTHSERRGEAGATAAIVVATVLTVGFGVAGAIRVRRDRASGLRLYATALMVDLLAGQAFKFTVYQFDALPGLAIDLVLLGLVSAERRVTDAGRPSRRGTGRRATLRRLVARGRLRRRDRVTG